MITYVVSNVHLQDDTTFQVVLEAHVRDAGFLCPCVQGRAAGHYLVLCNMHMLLTGYFGVYSFSRQAVLKDKIFNP